MNHLMSGYRWLWVAWVAMFLVLEFTAIFRQRTKDTLSGFTWDVCRVTPGQTVIHWTALHFFVCGFLVWLLVHISTGYWR